MAKLLAEIFERMRQPGLVGEILAGILLGPSLLGWVRPNQMLSALAELGVLFLLFRVGLEVKSSELVRVGKTATIVAFLGVVAPFLVGWGIMRLWGAPGIESIFVGAAMVATSVGITAHVLASNGLLDHPASKIILAAAVIDDVLGLIVLAVVSSFARGEINVTELVVTAVGAIGFTIVVAKWGSRAMGRVVPRLEERLKAGEVQFNLAVVVLFGLALLAMCAGVAAIIGAFLAGMALSDSLQPRVHDLAHGVAELLVPFFLVGIGTAPGSFRFHAYRNAAALGVNFYCRRSIKACRLRGGRPEHGARGCVSRRCGDGTARGGGHGRRTNRTESWRHSFVGLRSCRIYGRCDHRSCTSIAHPQFS